LDRAARYRSTMFYNVQRFGTNSGTSWRNEWAGDTPHRSSCSAEDGARASLSQWRVSG
jgi:hypothetical protein